MDTENEAMVGIGENMDEACVQKSQPLFWLWKSELTLAEFKILDTYLARINSHDPSKRTVIFKKGELERILGTQIRPDQLKVRLRHLMGNVVELKDGSADRGFKLITLFEEAEAEQDEDGLWQIRLECTQKAMRYFFNVEKLGYLRYKLRCVTKIKSRYSYIMFMYIESNRFRKSWNVPIDELRQMLGANEESYKQYKYFNDLVLKKAHKEITDKTDCKYSYEPIKNGRAVKSIRFTVDDLVLQESIADDGCDSMAVGTIPDLWTAAVADYGFSMDELHALGERISGIPETILPATHDGDSSIDARRYAYMQIKVADMRRHKVKNPYPYLVKMIDQDLTAASQDNHQKATPHNAGSGSQENKNKFHNFNQRHYTKEFFDILEKTNSNYHPRPAADEGEQREPQKMPDKPAEDEERMHYRKLVLEDAKIAWEDYVNDGYLYDLTSPLFMVEREARLSGDDELVAMLPWNLPKESYTNEKEAYMAESLKWKVAERKGEEYNWNPPLHGMKYIPGMYVEVENDERWNADKGGEDHGKRQDG